MDKEKGSQSPKVAEGCATENKMDWDKLNTCYMGNEGHQLELGYYNETASLQPPHKYTPWVTINGEVSGLMINGNHIDKIDVILLLACIHTHSCIRTYSACMFSM